MRKSWDEYFLSIAHNVAERSTCNRKQVGCVIVRDRAILSTGYAGSVRGQPHCTDVGCDIGPDGGCRRTIHAETNAVSLAAKHGTCIDGATAYVTLSPCYNCFKMLVNSGIRNIVYDEEYRIPLDLEMVAKCEVGYEHAQMTPTPIKLAHYGHNEGNTPICSPPEGLTCLPCFQMDTLPDGYDWCPECKKVWLKIHGREMSVPHKDLKLEAVKRLIQWRGDCSDMYGEDLVSHVIYQLTNTDLDRIPEEHRPALGTFRRFGGEFAYSLVRQVLKV